jgi:hypothetical protein
VLRWVNLALAVVLAGLLLMEFSRSRDPGPAVSGIGEAPAVVVQERPSRRSRRVEARMAIEEAQRKQRERLRGPAGPPMFDQQGKPVMD